MVDIIWYAVMLLTALLIYLLGNYAQKLEKPMGFWSGCEVDASTITDVKAYNRENAILWKCYSLWYVAAGVAWYWSHTVGMVFLVGGCTLGIVILIAAYLNIEKKYTKK